MEYQADLGCWERGITVDFEAESSRKALDKAYEFLRKEIDSGKLSKDSYVVQIEERNGDCVYDYMNLFFKK